MGCRQASCGLKAATTMMTAVVIPVMKSLGIAKPRALSVVRRAAETELRDG